MNQTNLTDSEHDELHDISTILRNVGGVLADPGLRQLELQWRILNSKADSVFLRADGIWHHLPRMR